MEDLDLDDDPELVGIEVYVTSARRAYAIADRYRARGAHVVLGGLHVTSCPDEAARHADTIVLGPAEEAWPRFLADFRAGRPRPVYRSEARTLAGLPRVRRDLIRRELYLVPNSLVVSRGCPHACAFCYKDGFFSGGRSFYVQPVEDALAEIERLPGRHLYFLDDHLFGHPAFAEALFDGMRGMGRLWQAAGTVDAVLRPGLLEKAVACGLRSLFVGFETLGAEGLRAQGKRQNLGRDYGEAVRRLHDLGVMVNASFVFGFDEDDASVFERTVEWAIAAGSRDRDVPRADALPGHGAVPADGGGRAAPAPRLGPLRHPPRGLPPRAHDPAAARGGLLARLPRLLPWGSILRGAATQARPPRRAAPRRLRHRLEEVRAGLGPPHPRPSRGPAPCRCSRGSSPGPRGQVEPTKPALAASAPRPPAERDGRTCYRPARPVRGEST